MSKNGQALSNGLHSFLPGAKGKTPIEAHWHSLEFQGAYPALFQLLAMAVDETGAVREGASVILFCESDRLKACIVDKHTGQRSFLVLSAQEPLYEQLERGIQAGLEWKEKRNAFGASPTH